MKLRFVPVDGRGAALEARITAGDEDALSAFGSWCEASLPPAGDTWSRLDVPVGGSTARHDAEPVERRIFMVFGDPWLARRFREAWC